MIPLCSDCAIRPALIRLWAQDCISLCFDCLKERTRDLAVAFPNPLAMAPVRLADLIEAHAEVVSLQYRNGIATWCWTPEWPGVAA